MNENFSTALKQFCAAGAANWHEHVWFNKDNQLDMQSLERLIALSDRFGVQKVTVSLPVTSGPAEPELVRRANDTVAKAVMMYPGRLYGMCYVDPGFHDFALREVERCILELGFVGIKLYNQYFINDAVVEDVLSLAARLDVPVLEHAGCLNAFADTQPFISDGRHFALAAQKHPNTVMILAHIGGGGDWQYQVKAIADCPNVYVDMSGSVFDEGMLEYAVRVLGAHRVLFGSDGSMLASVGKIMGCNLSEKEKEKILRGDDFARYLNKSKQNGGRGDVV